MDSRKNADCLMILAMVLASLVTFPCARAQDCQQNPEECDATQVLANFKFIDIVVTSDPKPPTYCEKYERTSLSEDGATVEYNAVYILAGGDNTLVNDVCTFQVQSNTAISISCLHYSEDTYELTLDYVNGNNCFVGHCNCTEHDSFQYYLLSNPYSDISEYVKCFKKIDEYSGDQVLLVYDSEYCQSLTPGA